MYAPLDIEHVNKNAIDIVFGIDDVISMGYRESVTQQEVINQIKMDSADEKAMIALLKQREDEAKKAAEQFGKK